MQLAAVKELTIPPALSITPEYLNYNKGPLYLVIVATLVTIALSTFLLRVYTRIKLLRSFGVDDCLCLVAVLCSIGALVGFVTLERLGIGRHLYAIPPEDLTQLARWQWYSTLFTVIGISFVKLSAAFSILQMVHQPHYRRFLYSLIGILVLLTLVWLATVALQYIPVLGAWEPFIRSPRCIARTAYKNLGLFNGAANATTDLLLTILPLTLVWALQVSLQTRVILVAILSLGFLACAAAIIRIPMIYNVWDAKDLFGHSAWFIVWSIIEMTVGITVICLSSLKSLLTTLITAISSLKTTRRGPHASHPHPTRPPPHPSAHSNNSHDNFLTLPIFNHTFHAAPKHAYLRRFHDHESCLDFDLETPPPRTRTHSQVHSRTASGVTNFSMPILDTPMRSRKGSRGLEDMDENLLEVSGSRSGYAVSITSGEENWGEDDGRMVRRVGSDEGSVMRLGAGSGEEGPGGIVRTTTTEVTIT